MLVLCPMLNPYKRPPMRESVLPSLDVDITCVKPIRRKSLTPLAVNRSCCVTDSRKTLLYASWIYSRGLPNLAVVHRRIQHLRPAWT